jgi:amino acid permease
MKIKTAPLYILANQWHVFIRRIRDSRSGSCEELCPLGCNGCSLLTVNWLSARTFHLHLQGWKVEQTAKQNETGSKQKHGCLFPTCLLLSLSWIMMMEETYSSETPTDFQRIIRHYITEYINLRVFIFMYCIFIIYLLTLSATQTL